MLEEILDTRQMVKRSMKMYNQEAKKNPSKKIFVHKTHSLFQINKGFFLDVELENDSLQKILHSRQLGLKLIANVTYGYTSANFSGRMPCIEVQKFRSPTILVLKWNIEINSEAVIFSIFIISGWR